VAQLYVFHQSAERINRMYVQHLTELILPAVQRAVESENGAPFLLFSKLVLD
jgi:hypothetical protein